MSKHCPKCQATQFKAKVIRPGIIEFDEAGSAVLIKEVPNFVVEVVSCYKCKEPLTNEDLLPDTVSCSVCGKPVVKEELIDGMCPVCDAMKNRADLSSASPEDLVKMILDLEKATVGNKIEKKLENSTATDTAVGEKNVAAEDKTAEEAKKAETARKAAETKKANAEKKKKEAEDAARLAQQQANQSQQQQQAPQNNVAQSQQQAPTNAFNTVPASTAVVTGVVEDQFETPNDGSDVLDENLIPPDFGNDPF